jgi:hypothetical protein
MSWCGFNLAGTPESITELKRLQREETLLKAQREDLECRNKKLTAALEESLKLQSHYAKLLNFYDNGQRREFNSSAEWLARLDEIEWKWE